MICEFPLCKQATYKNDLCINHYRVYGSLTGLQKKDEVNPKPIKKISKKQSVVNRELSKKIKEWIKNNRKCEVKSPACTGAVESTHHLQKRSPKNVLDEKNIIPCCLSCNSYIESNSDWAKQNGFTKSKFK